MEEIVIYEKTTCSTCRAAISLLNEQGVEFRKVRYYDEPLTKEKLAELIRKMGISARELVRKGDAVKAGVEVEAMSEEELIEAMIENPDLMQRPILERGDRAILGRPPERILEFLHTL
jgi:arsenate reductase